MPFTQPEIKTNNVARKLSIVIRLFISLFLQAVNRLHKIAFVVCNYYEH